MPDVGGSRPVLARHIVLIRRKRIDAVGVAPRVAQHVKPKQRDLAGSLASLRSSPPGFGCTVRPIPARRSDPHRTVRIHAAARHAGVSPRQRRVDVARKQLMQSVRVRVSHARWSCCRESAVRCPAADCITYGACSSGLTVWMACVVADCCNSAGGRNGRKEIRIVDHELLLGDAVEALGDQNVLLVEPVVEDSEAAAKHSFRARRFSRSARRPRESHTRSEVQPAVDVQSASRIASPGSASDSA